MSSAPGSAPTGHETPAAELAPLGLYVHVPFCEVKCSYCHFAIDPGRPDAAREERYLRALVAEIAARDDGGSRADTLYFGGGTPSLMAGERLARLVTELARRFRLPPGAELTVEANPGDLDAAGYAALVACGANRLSLGVQSLDDGVLREMGRRHGAAEALRALERARGAGFASVSADLILGWPGESRARFEPTLRELVAAAPDHVSLYVLEVSGRTLLAHRQRRGLLQLPDDDLVADLYRLTCEALGAAGFERYEISNFARPGHRSRHNARYWDDAPFLGFGMGAHSYRDGVRSFNHDRFGSYCRAVEERGGGAAVAGARRLTPEERCAEAAFTGLRRREGIDLAAFRARYGIDPLERWGAGLADAFLAGLVERDGDHLRLTDAGGLLSNEVFQAFV